MGHDYTPGGAYPAGSTEHRKREVPASATNDPKPLPNRKVVRRLVGVTGATRSRNTQVVPHPMRTSRTVLSSLRSSNPRIRLSAKAAAIALGVLAAPTPKATGWRRPKWLSVPLVTGTRRNGKTSTREG